MRYPVCIVVFTFLLLCWQGFVQCVSAQTILYATGFGTQTNVLPAGWNFTGVNLNLNNLAPSGGYPGASQGVYLAEGNHKAFRNTSGTMMSASATGVSTATFQFAASGHTDLELMFGMCRTVSYPTLVNYQLAWSTDGVIFTPITFSEPIAGSWGLVNVTLPAACNNRAAVYLRWTFNRIRSSAFFKIDDVRVIANDLCVPPVINIQPASPPLSCIGSSVLTFQVIASGTGPFTYQWQENGTNISDGQFFNGTQTAQLKVLFPNYGFNGNHYRCVISNCAGVSIQTDNQAILQLKTITGDVNYDGSVNNTDFVDFLSFWQTPCNCVYDFNVDGFVDMLDFLVLVANFNLACSGTN